VDDTAYAKSGLGFFIVLPLDVWDSLVAEQPSSEEWHIDIRPGLCPNFKDEDYDYMGSSSPLDNVCRIVRKLKLMFRFSLVYSFKVRQSLACMIT
jgi:hypothetical protein